MNTGKHCARWSGHEVNRNDKTLPNRMNETPQTWCCFELFKVAEHPLILLTNITVAQSKHASIDLTSSDIFIYTYTWHYNAFHNHTVSRYDFNLITFTPGIISVHVYTCVQRRSQFVPVKERRTRTQNK